MQIFLDKIKKPRNRKPRNGKPRKTRDYCRKCNLATYFLNEYRCEKVALSKYSDII